MKKSDKKMDNAVRRALTQVCESALYEVSGFKWITHVANYSNFPGSLLVVCVFDTKDNLSNAMAAHKDDYFFDKIKDSLDAADIHIADVRRHVNFDTEEACQDENEGKWHERL